MSSYVFVGDSITYGYYATVQSNRFSTRATARQQGATENNQGTPGARIANILSNFPGNLPSADVTILEIGTNDFGNTVLATAQSQLQTLLGKVTSPKTIVLGVWRGSGDNDGAGNSAVQWDAAFKAAITASGISGATFVSLYPLYANVAYHNVNYTSTYLGASDTFHPSDAGHLAIASEVVRAIGNTATIWQVGSYSPQTDAFTVQFDLNDFQQTWVHSDSVRPQKSKKKVVKSSNIRSRGARIVRAQRADTDHLTMEVYTHTTSAATARTVAGNLVAAIESPPYVLRMLPVMGTDYTHFDVVNVDHNEPYDPKTQSASAILHMSLDFEVQPDTRKTQSGYGKPYGTQLTCQNLVGNPGFEWPGAAGVVAFGDTFVNTNAYTTVAGSAPSVASNVLTVPNGTTVSFGSPAWSAIQTWKLRFTWVTGLFASFDIHYTDANNKLQVQVGGTQIGIFDHVAGTGHTIATNTPTLTNGAVYWIQITQFPSVPGDPPYIAATLYADSGGTVGAAVTNGGVAGSAYDAVTALQGKCAIEASGAALTIGGNFTAVHQVLLFGPGGWTCTPVAGTATGACAGSWDGANFQFGMSGSGGSNTYPSGGARSFGAARIDLPPAGTVGAFWSNYIGATPAGSPAMPVSAAGNVLAASAQVMSSGLGASAVLALILQEWDTNGSFLRQTTLQSVTGNQASWTKLAGTVTTGTSCAFASVAVQVTDSTTGSANGIVWFDNAQCWNVTTTGQSTMPYCELRFSQSPAQLLVTGIQGDAPARAMVATGMYVGTSWTNSALTLWLGRRNQASAGAILVGVPSGSIAATYAVPQLDSSAYGGFTVVVGGSVNSRGFQIGGTPLQSDMLGIYHEFCRLYPSVTSVTLQGWQVQELAQSTALYPQGYALTGGNISNLSPSTAQNAWNVLDCGQVQVPYSAQGALNDPKQLELSIGVQVNATSIMNGTKMNWLALLPVGGDLVILQWTVPSGATQQDWVYLYADGLGIQTGQSAAMSFSLEAVPIANPAQGAGAGGVASEGYYQLLSGADPYMTLDPTEPMQLNGTAVNQFVCVATDNTGAVLPVVTEIHYSPTYLFPR